MSLRNEVLRSALGSKTASGGADMKSSQQFVRDTVTPYKVCLLVLIREFLVSLSGTRFRLIHPLNKKERVCMTFVNDDGIYSVSASNFPMVQFLLHSV